MPVLASVASHLPVDELFERYRDCDDARLKSHWHILWLRAPGQPIHQLSRAAGDGTSGLYLCRFVHPASGDVRWLTMPLINIEAWKIALEEFAKAVGAGPNDASLKCVMSDGSTDGRTSASSRRRCVRKRVSKYRGSE